MNATTRFHSAQGLAHHDVVVASVEHLVQSLGRQKRPGVHTQMFSKAGGAGGEPVVLVVTFRPPFVLAWLPGAWSRLAVMLASQLRVAATSSPGQLGELLLSAQRGRVKVDRA